MEGTATVLVRTEGVVVEEEVEEEAAALDGAGLTVVVFKTRF